MSEVNFTEQAEATQEKVRELSEASAKPAVENNLPAKYNPVISDFIPAFKDLRLPRLNIVHGIGKLKDTFTVGGLVYNGQFELYVPKRGKNEATPPVETVILGWLPLRYAEKTTEGRGMLVSTEEEVRRAGGTLDWNEWKLKEESGMRYFSPLMEAVVLVRQPEFLKDDDANFPFVIDDVRYLLALLPMKGMTYNNTAKGLFTLRQVGCLRERGYPSYSFSVTVEWKGTTGDRGSFIPFFKPLRKTSDAFQKYALDLINGPPRPPAGSEADDEQTPF
jgi:hypothetical protein